MNLLWKDICKILAWVTWGIALSMVIPFGIAIYYQYFVDQILHPQPHTSLAFLESIIITVVLGMVFAFIGRGAKGSLYRREGLALVVLIWFLSPAITALPFLLSNTLNNPLQAYFETTSGLTTTGASIIQAKTYDDSGKEVPVHVQIPGEIPTNYYYWGNVEPIRDPITNEILHQGIEAIGKALLFWRSFLQFLGGGGIVVLFVAILPILGVGGKILFHTEVTGPMKGSLTPRVTETAVQLWKIYLGLNLLQILVLIITNPQMELFDAITVAFGTISTGGFAIHSTSIGYYNNAWTEWVIIIFMIVGSLNFSLYYYILKGKIYRLYETEFLIFILIVLCMSFLVSWNLVGAENALLDGEQAGRFSVSESIRHGTFQIVSAISTTGYATVNFDHWPYVVQVLMIIGMYLGGMSGSTASGIKTMRLYMLFRVVQHKVETLFRPEAVRKFKIGDREVDNNAAIFALSFFLVIIAVSVVGVVFLVMDGCDPETSLGIVACMVNDAGFSFRAAGPTESFAFLSNYSLITTSLLMLLGRLEFFAVLAILVPAFWKHNG